MKRSVFIVLLSLVAAAQTPNPHQAIVDRLESFTTKSLPDWRYHADIPHPEAYTLDDSSWPTVRLDERWSSGSRVLRHKIDIPPYFNGYAIKGASLKLDLAFDSNGPLVISIFSNGNLVYHGTDTAQQPILLTENAMPGQQILIAVRLDAQEVETRISRSRLLVTPEPDRPNPALIREEILALTPMIAAFPEGRAERERQFNEALQSINFTALKNGELAVFDKSLTTAQTKLEALNPWLKQFTIRIVGNSHIDMAWLWPWTETVEVVRNTFRSVLDLMREYPDFKFTMSSARAYEWMEEKYPDLFKEIEQRVKEGRWEIVGGMWVEPDLNMPAGESLTRQILVGKRYFEKKFGRRHENRLEPRLLRLQLPSSRRSTKNPAWTTSLPRNFSGPTNSPSSPTSSSGGKPPTAAASSPTSRMTTLAASTPRSWPLISPSGPPRSTGRSPPSRSKPCTSTESAITVAAPPAPCSTTRYA